jgi:acyl-coenzyme A synthetase/AMP-(fatty) acid ligase
VPNHQLWKSNIGLLFDHRAELGKPMIFRLSRPLDIDPSGRTLLDIDEIADIVRRTSAILHAAGVRSGDHVAVFKENHFDCLLLAAAASRIGAVPVLLSGLLPDDSVRALLHRSEPRLLVSDARRLTAGAAGGTPLTDLAERTLSLDADAPGALTPAALDGADAPPPAPRRNDELLMLTHTSGTTGIPKLIMYTPAKLQGQMARLECRHLPPITFRRNDTVAVFMPYVHARAFTWIYSALTLSPHKVLLMSDSEPENVRPLFREHPPTAVEALPIDFDRLEGLARERRANVFSSVRMFASTFDAVYWSTIRTFLNASRHPFPLWRYGYGQSETGGLGMTFVTRRTANRRRDERPGPRTVGRPMPTFVQIKVVDPETFRPVPDGRPGLVFARTKARCAGYYREPERWREKAVGEWWNTGDIGIKTRTGRIKLLDREVNHTPGLSCLELEDVLVDLLPERHDVALLAVSDGPPVPVVATPDGRLDPQAWRTAVSGLPVLADPVVVALADVPRTGTGKIRREELRRRHLGEAARPGTGRWT